jgi:hypothetical protein
MTTNEPIPAIQEIEEKRQRLMKAMRDAMSPEDLEQIADVLATKKGRTAQADAAKAREMAAQFRAERSAGDWKRT